MRLNHGLGPVRQLSEDSAFQHRILQRFTHCLEVDDSGVIPAIRLAASDTIPEWLFYKLIVVKISGTQPLAARVLAAWWQTDGWQLALMPWVRFTNHDPQRGPLPEGLHLWVGSGLRHLPFPRTA
jgi:hypothetical protein